MTFGKHDLGLLLIDPRYFNNMSNVGFGVVSGSTKNNILKFNS